MHEVQLKLVFYQVLIMPFLLARQLDHFVELPCALQPSLCLTAKTVVIDLHVLSAECCC